MSKDRIVLTLYQGNDTFEEIVYNFPIVDQDKIYDQFRDLIEPTVDALVTSLKIELATDVDIPLEEAI